ncbi:uncharacterized protein LOC135474106 isoform X2 [Liolophura sinensis]|uniref:uncharacterized protein LOC135474106 isoform X2 n=1 Tax=Liolophura sinensis TaxID=3198878 RepID=UPI003158C028
MCIMLGEYTFCMLSVLRVLLHCAAECPIESELTLQANEKRQVLTVHSFHQPSQNTTRHIHCTWHIYSPEIHSSLMLQILDLAIEDDTDNFLQIRECYADSCPDTCGEEFDPEEENEDCHQWCEESGPENEFKTSDCAHVELSLTDSQSGRGLLLAFWSTTNDVTVVGQVTFTLANYLLFGMTALSVLVMLIAILLILNHRKWHLTMCPRSRNTNKIIMVAPASSVMEC